jgi:hypothetical protein
MKTSKYRKRKRRAPYQQFSFEALTILLAHAKKGSEDEQLLIRELRFRKTEPKYDPGQSLLFAGSEWERAKSPWCVQEHFSPQNKTGVNGATTLILQTQPS